MNQERRISVNKFLSYIQEHPNITGLITVAIGGAIGAGLVYKNMEPANPEFTSSQKQIEEVQQPRTVFNCENGDQVFFQGDLRPETSVLLKSNVGEVKCEPNNVDQRPTN